MSIRTRTRDERGLVGKIAIVWLLLLAMFVVAAVDAGSIALTRFKVANAADKAAFAAAGAYKDTQDRTKALEAAEAVVDHDLPNARIPEGGFEIDTRTGDATVKIVDKAWSLVAARWSYTRPFTKVSATSTSQPPTL
jgi:uncharacterized membrane protein